MENHTCMKMTDCLLGCCDRPDDGGSKHLWNVGKFLPDYMTQQPRRRPSLYSPPWEPEITHSTCSLSGYFSNLTVYRVDARYMGRWYFSLYQYLLNGSRGHLTCCLMVKGLRMTLTTPFRSVPRLRISNCIFVRLHGVEKANNFMLVGFEVCDLLGCSDV
jgi:hypothetical protein